MLTLTRKRHGVKVIDCWYATEEVLTKGIVTYHQSLIPLGKENQPFDTLVSDLRPTKEEITAAFSKSCKYKINRAPREGVAVELFNGGDVTDEIISQFLDFYAAFYESKGYGDIGRDHLMDEMKRYRDAGALSVHVAYIGEEPVVYHTHILTEEYARLYHSASLYRVIEGINPNVVGMANRYLHQVDMFTFKEMGKKTYDWGGAGRGEEVLKITEFKESFGGTPAIHYNGETVIGGKAKLYRRVTSLL